MLGRATEGEYLVHWTEESGRFFLSRQDAASLQDLTLGCVPQVTLRDVGLEGQPTARG